jgi:hypothetical protein
LGFTEAAAPLPDGVRDKLQSFGPDARLMRRPLVAA